MEDGGELAEGELLTSYTGTSTDCVEGGSTGMQHGNAAGAPALGEEEMLAELWLKLLGQMEPGGTAEKW